jgi:NAD(P)-dependent dehydrogenase (short-subunit alcohol dehydrogenase family)
MNLNLENKVFIVTGGASGIGESIVRKLADAGAIACIIDRNEKAILKLYHELEGKEKKVFYVLTELTQINSCKNAIDQILSRYGKIDGLVNNAGLNDGVSLEYGNYEQFMESLNKNVCHYYAMGYFTLASLKRSAGSIVNICSKVAETGQGGTSGYAAANGVRFDLTSQWAIELLPLGIRVNAVVVAECWTPQYEWWINQQPDPQEKLSRINSKIPLSNRMTTPDEIADTVLFLLSSKSNSINGEFVHVDGGYVHLDRQ